MCLDCGCGEFENDHGDPAHLTLAALQAAADASGVTVTQAAENILAAVYTALAAPETIAKDAVPQKFCLGIAYQAGRDPRIAKGLDGGRDCFSETELEKACWSFMLSGQQHGMFHADGTEGAARPVENYIYRNPIPWVAAPDLVVRKGDWVLGALLEDRPWELARAGKANGWSPQGGARRRQIRGGP
jgi:Putative phage serine protease XkdF